MSELLTKLKGLKTPQERVSGVSVISTPIELASTAVSGGRVFVDVNTLRVLSDVVFKVVGKDYSDLIYNLCSSSPTFLSVCRDLAEAVVKCDKKLVKGVVPSLLTDLVKYVEIYIDSYCTP